MPSSSYDMTQFFFAKMFSWYIYNHIIHDKPASESTEP